MFGLEDFASLLIEIEHYIRGEEHPEAAWLAPKVLEASKQGEIMVLLLEDAYQRFLGA